MLLLSLGLTVPFACSKDRTNKRIGPPEFSIEVPFDWEYFPQQGIEDYIGLFTDGQDSIQFMYGCSLSNFQGIDRLNESYDSAKILSEQDLLLDGVEAKIIKHRGVGEDEVWSLFVDTRDGCKRNSLHCRKPGNPVLLVEMYKTHRFN